MKIEAINKRMFSSKVVATQYSSALKQLTEKSKLPEYMGELFLSEIVASVDDANEHLRERAVMLGLAKEVKGVM